ncbi:tripartite tricarboxylate transporter substrate binding protein [Oceanimonas sp. CHS3-5]|uniref:Bug family tripartite tricarboxylate transporter substrate binding protein n=1 Tax=Oceanimonas sp. CHS3-5 TaxID=3068186 RepID=UPI00273DE1C4|nr:tripartite tricarboxylate transporter substrate binding protein [Oceanimonas sp. CHS3-5]MDP5292981.1 tripartite tricarboxylate transporter substrate binding protein [Oceanimonas sp. CHS3-5]
MAINNLLKTTLLLSAGIALSCPAYAEYPSRPISLVIPYGTGGVTDISARALAQAMADEVSKPLVLVNRTGAGGAAGSAFVAHSKGDGYTMMAARVGSHTVNPAMKKTLPYQLEDFKMVGVYEINPVVCITSRESGIESINQLVDKVRAEPGSVSYSSSGVGSLQQLAGTMVMNAFGVEKPLESTVHLPMRGGGEAATAVLNGTATFLCESSAAVAGFIKNGQANPLLVTTKERLQGIDAPTASELGHPELEALLGWTGIAGPETLKPEVVASWEKWMNTATRNPTFVDSMEKLGSIVVNMGPEESEKFINGQYHAFRELVVKMNMQVN